MAGLPIATLDDLIGAIGLGDNLRVFKTGPTAIEAVGNWVQFMDRGGVPGAISKPNPGGINGSIQTRASSSGYIPFVNAGGGRKKYVGAASIYSNVAATLALYDVLWHNWSTSGGIVQSTLTEQVISTPEWPDRDNNAASDGEGVEIWLTNLSADTTNAAAITTTTLNYTNSDGVGGRTAPLAYSYPATCRANTMVPFALAAGDKGVRSIQGITLGTTYAAGDLALMAMRPIFFQGIAAANAAVNMNFSDLGLPRIFDDSALIFAILATTTTVPIIGANLRMAEW